MVCYYYILSLHSSNKILLIDDTFQYKHILKLAIIKVLSGYKAVEDLGKNATYALLHEIYCIPSISNYTGNDPNVGFEVLMSIIGAHPFPELFDGKRLTNQTVKVVKDLFNPFIDNQPFDAKDYYFNPKGPFHGRIRLPAFNDTSSGAITSWNQICLAQFVGIIPFTQQDIIKACTVKDNHMIIQELPFGYYPCCHYLIKNLSRTQFFNIWIWFDVPKTSQITLGNYIFDKQDFEYKTFIYYSGRAKNNKNWVRYPKKLKSKASTPKKKLLSKVNANKNHNNHNSKKKQPTIAQAFKSGQVSKIKEKQLTLMKARLVSISQTIKRWANKGINNASMIITQDQIQRAPINNITDTKALLKKIINDPDDCEHSVFDGEIISHITLKPLSDTFKSTMKRNGTTQEKLINLLIQLADIEILSKQSKPGTPEFAKPKSNAHGRYSQGNKPIFNPPQSDNEIDTESEDDDIQRNISTNKVCNYISISPQAIRSVTL